MATTIQILVFMNFTTLSTKHKWNHTPQMLILLFATTWKNFKDFIIRGKSQSQKFVCGVYHTQLIWLY